MRDNEKHPQTKENVNDESKQNTHHEISLQEKGICLALTGRLPELPYPLKEVECADGTVQRIYVIPDADKAKVLADLYPMSGAPSLYDTLYDIHERNAFKVRDFLVIPLGRGQPPRQSLFPTVRLDARGLGEDLSKSRQKPYCGREGGSMPL